MAYVSHEEFKKFQKLIPKDRIDYIHFILLRQDKKPAEKKSWKTDKTAWLNNTQISNRMHNGFNIGVVALPKGIMFLDIDTDDKSQLMVSNEILRTIPDTLTVRTRSKGLHFYFLNDGEYDNQLFTLLYLDGELIKPNKLPSNPAELKEFYLSNKDRLTEKNVGELRTNWQYVLSAGSWVMPSTYRIINEVPIAKFEGKITEFFKEGITDKPDKPKKPFGNDKPMPDNVKKIIESGNKGIVGTDERRKELISMLKARGIKRA